tara:strand:+ start:1542 stop:2288 length:747 start_codon:yes stop_codon:yes gene_type:complete
MMKVSKKSVGILVLLITVIGMLFAINPTLLSLKKLPDENFTNLILIEHIETECEEDDLMCLIMSESGSVYRSSASGIAFKSSGGMTYILTAGHFCSAGYNTENSWELKVVDIDGKYWDGQIVNLDMTRDLCLISSDMPAVRSVNFTDQMPDMGERVFTISAPLGVSDRDVVLHFEGIFSGCSNSLTCYFTIPTTFGSSGSAIFDSKRRIVGITLRSLVGFESVAMGTNGSEIIGFINRSQSEFKIEPR